RRPSGRACMSGPDRNDLPTIETVEDEAAGWLWRQHQVCWQDADQVAFDKWLATSNWHLAAYWRLKATWNRTERLVALKSSQTLIGNRQERRAKPLLRLSAIACSIALLGSIVVYSWTTHTDSYATKLGERATVALSDGSQIQLNTDTQI